MKNLRTKAVRASGWVLGSNVISQAISFCFGIALARFLMPDDFGLIAMVMVFTGLASLLSDVGLGAALIQKKDANKLHFNSVFWLNISFGCSLFVLLFLSSTWISVFYGRVEVGYICRALSITFIISALALVPRTIFMKGLQFKYIALAELVSMIVSGVIAVFMAVNDFGYWSLVTLKLSQVLVSTMLIWSFSAWRPTPCFSWHAIRELFGFSASIFGTNFLQYVTTNIDKLLLGRMLGGDVLGVYDKAQSMMLFPLRNISHVMGSVMFPSMSLVQTDTVRVKKIYLRSTQSIALLTFPMMTGLFVVADSFVLGVLGPHWTEIIPVLRIFCIAGVATSIVTVTGSLYQSQGAALLQFRVNMFTQPMRIIGVIIGIYWGVIGVATGYTVALVINSLITLTIATRLVNLRLATLILSLIPILLMSLVMAFMISAIQPVLNLESHLILFFVQIVIGVIIYWGGVVIVGLKAYEDVVNVLHEEYVSWRQDNS